MNSPLFSELSSAATEKGIKLVPGKGSDKDTLRTRTVWVMDSNLFPFQQGEIYHQYHG